MEDAATVEISGLRLWQWIRNRTRLVEGPRLTRELVDELIDEEVGRLNREVTPPARHV